MKRFWAFLLTLCMLFTQQNMVVLAADLGDVLAQEPVVEAADFAEKVVVELETKNANVTSGTLGMNNGFQWNYDANTKTLIVSGEDVGIVESTQSPFVDMGIEIEKIVFQDCTFKGSLSFLMRDLEDVKAVEFYNCDTSNVTTANSMFEGCTSLTSLDVSSFNTGKITNMRNMFYGCSSLTTLDVSNFDTSNVVYFEGMFRGCSNLKNIDVSGFDTSSATTMHYMFSDCSSVKELDVSKFDTSKVTDVSNMFANCAELTSLDFSNLDLSNILIPSAMLVSCNKLEILHTPKVMQSGSEITLPGVFRITEDTPMTMFSSEHCNMILHKTGYYITYVLNGGTNSSENPSSYDMQSPIILSDATRQGYVFGGWYLEADYKNQIKSLPNTDLGDITLYAKWDVYEIAVPDKPYNIVNTVSGVHVYWRAPKMGVKKYGLWRSETGKNGTYKWIANPTVPHFTDTKVESGKTYYYKVTVCETATDTGKQTHGKMSEALGITFTSTPDITSRINKAAGIQLGWEKISGATGYAIYRKNYSLNDDDAWERIATIKGGNTVSYIDTSVKNKNGSVYKYTIRALYNNTLSGCRSAGRTMARLTSRELTSATRRSAVSIKCNWTTSKNVTGYEIRFMVGDKVYKTFKEWYYGTGTKVFAGLETGKKYKIQVRSFKEVKGVGDFYSAWSEPKYVTLQ